MQQALVWLATCVHVRKCFLVFAVGADRFCSGGAM